MNGALTGVGPSIASGNQTCSGNCPDLPTAPQKIRRINGARAERNECGALTAASIIAKDMPPCRARECQENPRSPMRVVIKPSSPRRRARLIDPKSDQQQDASPTNPADEKKKQIVRDDHAEHRAGENERYAKNRVNFVLGHVADAEDKCKARPGSSPASRRRAIEHPSDTERLFESEPGEIVNSGNRAFGASMKTPGSIMRAQRSDQ